ncbi:MAG: ABC-F family ATP-binding cassette domain-containing protein [Clostridia bacterium]|nr:ABC-F family ATP-binding cassette domain-containing protein [Clostridia bacterium]
MALITVSNLSVEFGELLLFDNMNFEIQKGDRIGLIGVNGCGKTTLFKLLTGEYSPSGGDIIINKNITVGYMEQHVCRNLERSAYEEVLSVFSDLLEMEKELEGLNALIGSVSSELEDMVERQSYLHDEFTRRGGLTCRSRARSALLGLGFDDEKMQLPIRSLSGGQRAKLQLAKLLLSDAELLLLDEPTNHLDTAAVEWLENYLTDSKCSFMVISHDRYFLDKTTNRTFELENRKMTRYNGNYTAYLPQKQEHELSMQRAYDNTIKEIERLEGIVEQQRRWNREKNIRTAESKLKVIERLEKTLEKPDSAPSSIKFDLSVKAQSGDDVLELDGVSLRFGAEPLFENVSMEIHRGERIFILGPNGCGKTSLLKTILGKYRASSGKIRFGVGVKTGYYDQIQTGMDSEKTVFEEISDCFPAMTNTEIRSTLARFLFKNDDVFKPLSALSGGERARVLLTELMLAGSNFLLLDEPTNHLDINSCAALQEALGSYEGTLLIVSHDRYLINALADKIFYLTPNGIQVYEGSYEDFLKRAEPFKTNEEKTKTQKGEKQTEYKNKREQDAQRRRDRARLNRLEGEISEKEDNLAGLNEQLTDPDIAADYEKLMELTSAIEAAEKELEALYAEWEEISERLG